MGAHALLQMEIMKSTAEMSEDAVESGQGKGALEDGGVIGGDGFGMKVGMAEVVGGANGVARLSEPRQCGLGPDARLSNVTDTGNGACLWTSALVGQECVYALSGTCKRITLHDCDFWGYPGNERRILSQSTLPGPVPGELPLSDEQAGIFTELFESCEKRPAFWLLHVLPGLTEPLPLLMGGGNIAQHVYFVEGEMSRDIYGLKKLGRPRMIVDIGANVGMFAIAACKLHPNAQIFAFEPHPMNYRFLITNLKQAGCADRVRAFNLGLTRDARSIPLYWAQSIGTSAYRPTEAVVMMRTINSELLWSPAYLGVNTNVSLVKVDCEGCEYEVIPLFNRNLVERIACEVHPLDGLPGLNVTTETAQNVKNACSKGRP